MSTIINDPITNVSVPDFEAAILVAAMVIYGSLVACGVLFVTIFVLVLIKGRVTFKEIPFFTIVWQSTICNFLGIYIQAFCKFPLLFVDTTDETTWQSTWETVGTHVVYFTDTGFTLFVVLMALNRFAVFVQPRMMVIFTKTRIWYPIGVTWLLVACIATEKILWGGVEKFDKKNWSITLLLVKSDGDIVMTVVSWLDYIASVLLLLIYSSIYFMIRKKRASHGLEDRDDTSLLTQAVVVALSLTIFRILANVSGAVHASDWVNWMLNILRFSASVCNNMLNPILFLTTKNVRNILKDMFHCGTRGAREETNSSEYSSSPAKGCCLPFHRVSPAPTEQVVAVTPAAVTMIGSKTDAIVTPVN